METAIKSFTLKDLERLSENWDRETKTVILFFDGAASSVGGYCNYYVLRVNGRYSSRGEGVIEIIGVAVQYYGIHRTGEGPSYDSIKYYEGSTDFNISSTRPTYTVRVDNNTTGAVAALQDILQAQKDYLKR